MDINKEQMEQLVRDLEARRKTGMNLHASDYALHYDSEKAITALLQEREELKTDNELLRSLSFRDERDALRAELEARDKQEPYAFAYDCGELTGEILCHASVVPVWHQGGRPLYLRPVAPAQVIPEWISVEDRLPEIGATVLGWNSDFGFRQCRYVDYGDGSPGKAQGLPPFFEWHEPQSHWISSWEPTHWMPLPAAPTPLEEKK